VLLLLGILVYDFQVAFSPFLQIPELVNSLVNYMLPPATVPGTSIDGLNTLLERPWDPVGKSVFRFDRVTFTMHVFSLIESIYDSDFFSLQAIFFMDRVIFQ
jgi:hypothetical protein